jgi:hypothetical protein
MRSIFKLICFIILVLAGFTSCKKKEQTRFQTSWSSKDPIAIPFNTRLNQQKLGNLVLNSSFESGKLFYKEKDIKTFDIDGWSVVGNHVEWVNRQNLEYKLYEVADGNHAVKVHREIADETEDLGDGILSDYIKVIPGNYSLKLKLKLKNIRSNKERLGFKLHDAVNIRIKYFDKNKIEIRVQEFNPFMNLKIDNTFNSQSFTNYYQINDQDWCDVYGKTADFPYFNGDIPDQARYAKIFIGLKGTGTLWIDKVEFNYTNQNFTLLERLEPYFDSSFTTYDMIMPTPQQIEAKGAYIYFNSDSNKIPVIIYSGKNKKLETVINNLKNKIDNIISVDQKVQTISSLKANELKKYSLIISVGDTKLLENSSTKMQDSLLNQNQDSYAINFNSESNIIFLQSITDEGLINGVFTLEQIFDKKIAIVYLSDILDYPDFYQRNYAISFGLDSDRRNLLDEYKFGVPYYYNASSLATTDSECNLIIDCGTEDYLVQLKSIRKSDFKNIESVIIRNLKNDKDLEEIIKLLEKKNKKLNIKFEPKFNSINDINLSQDKAAQYYMNLKSRVSKKLSYIWNGENRCSNSLDCINLNQVSNVMHLNPVLFDNELNKADNRFYSPNIEQYYAGKLRLLSLFEPYNFKTVDGFYRFNANREIILNIDSLTEFKTIQTLTAANYYWNTESYNPEKSLWIVLNKLYGREISISLLKFNDAVFGMKEMSHKIANNGLNNKNERILNVYRASVLEQFEVLQENINNNNLLFEIKEVKEKVLTNYDQIFLELNNLKK